MNSRNFFKTSAVSALSTDMTMNASEPSITDGLVYSVGFGTCGRFNLPYGKFIVTGCKIVIDDVEIQQGSRLLITGVERPNNH